MWIPYDSRIAVLPLQADRFSSLKYSLARTGHSLAAAHQLMRYSIVASVEFVMAETKVSVREQELKSPRACT